MVPSAWVCDNLPTIAPYCTRFASPPYRKCNQVGILTFWNPSVPCISQLLFFCFQKCTVADTLPTNNRSKSLLGCSKSWNFFFKCNCFMYVTAIVLLVPEIDCCWVLFPQQIIGLGAFNKIFSSNASVLSQLLFRFQKCMVAGNFSK